MTTDGRWYTGDLYGIAFPADLDSLRRAGPTFLTAAFRAAGTFGDDNRVTAISELRAVTGGSTGRKALLTVDYERVAPELPTDLFVKFSRDFDDPVRDRGRSQMAGEVRLAALSRTPGFPVDVPTTVFGDYHGESGSGVLITERIAFGRRGIEEQHHKCLDYEVADQAGHYRALITALARLAGAHRSGSLPPESLTHFPVDLRGATVGEQPTLTAGALERKLARLVTFCETHVSLVPPNLRDPVFLDRLVDDGRRVVEAEPDIWQRLSDPDHIALCHWNANIDNAWFWRSEDDVLHCGLLDWGCVCQMNVAMALWGALSGAEVDLWDTQFADLVQLFVTVVADSGGPHLDAERVRVDVLLYAAVMGVSWLLDVPGLLRSRFGDDTTQLRRTDPRIKDDESVRAPLQMLTNVLNLWQTHRIGDVVTTVFRPPSE